MSDKIKEEAIARHNLHIGHPTHRPLSDNYELVGLRGEEALANYFGLEVDLVRRPSGDGGVDNIICLEGIDYIVDVKCARKPFNLIVEEGKVSPKTIYILAGYDDINDTATLLGWIWGLSLSGAPTRDFGYGVINHYVVRESLMGMSELKEKHTPRKQMTAIITTADKLACAERELKMRERVYPRWVEADKMSAGKAALEIASMEAIVEDYKALVEKERLI